MTMNCAVLAFAGMLVVGCTIPQTPQQTVFAAKSTYVATGDAALVYLKQPTCAEPAVQPCKSPAVVDAIKKADNVAYAALDSAETVVRTPGFGDDAISSAATAASGAVDAFVKIVRAIVGGK